MLFYIVSIILVIAAINFGLSFIPTKNWKEYLMLKNNEEHKRQMWNYTSYPIGSDRDAMNTYNRIHDEYRQACQELNEFEEKHPKLRDKQYNKEIFRNVCIGFMIGAGICCFIMGAVIFGEHVSAPAHLEALKAEREVLVWEIENAVYYDNGDDVVGKKELYNQVREWNKALAKNKTDEKNFWYGIFIPNIYGDLEPIELK